MIRHGRPAKDEADLSLRGAHEARQATALARPQAPRDPAVSAPTADMSTWSSGQSPRANSPPDAITGDIETNPLAPRFERWAYRSQCVPGAWPLRARTRAGTTGKPTYDARRHSAPPRSGGTFSVVVPVDAAGLSGHLRGNLAMAQHQIGRAQMDGRYAGAEAEAAHGNCGRAAASSDERHPTSRWSRRTLGFDRVKRLLRMF